MNIGLRSKILLGTTMLFAVYNLLEIAVVASGADRNSINAYPDLLLPFLLVANLYWAVRRHTKASYVSLSLCIVSVIGIVLMLKSIFVSPF